MRYKSYVIEKLEQANTLIYASEFGIKRKQITAADLLVKIEEAKKLIDSALERLGLESEDF